MATKIRPELSLRNKYHIDKHRHYELKHFCLQYPTWKRVYTELDKSAISLSKLEERYSTDIPGDPTSNYAIKKARYSERIDLIEKTALAADAELHMYILKAVTEGLSYTYLKSRLDIPCGKDMYYDRYRRFFWLLSETRD